MNETEFLEKALTLFNRIETVSETCNVQIDAEQSGNVLTLENEAGEQVVLNVHTPTSEVWLASRAGGYRFVAEQDKWICSKDRQELQPVLERSLSYICNEPVRFGQKI